MFCPKCGENLPDNAAFCGNCGNKIEARKAPAATPKSPRVTGGSPKAAPVAAGGLSALKIAAMAVAAIAVVFAFLPWFESSTTLQNIGAIGNGIGQFGSAITGKNYHIASFDETYSVIGFLGLAGDLSQYSSSTPAPIFIIAFIAWLVGVILTVIGVIVMLATSRHSKALLVAGTIVLALTALAWTFMSAGLADEGYAAGIATNAIICAVLSIIAAILAIVAKKTA